MNLTIEVREKSEPWLAAPHIGDGRFHEREEEVVVGGVAYRRTSCKGGAPAGVPDHHFASRNGEHPGLLCGKCFNKTFTIVEDGYTVHVRCSECGYEDSLGG